MMQHETRQSVADRKTKKDDSRSTVRVKATPTRHRLAKTLVATGAAVALYGAAYAGAAQFFSTHFVPGTTVNGHDASWLTEAEVAAAIDSTTSSYQNEVTLGGLTFTLRADEIGLASNGDTCAHEAMGMTNPWMWPVRLFTGQDVSVREGITFDEAALEERVNQEVDAYNKDARSPEDASVRFDDERKSFVVSDAQVGTRVSKKNALAAVMSSVATQQTKTELGAEALSQPKRQADDPELKAAADRANEVLDLEIPVVSGEDEQTRVSRDQLAEWVSLDDDLNVSVDEEAIVAWASETLADAAARSDDDYDYALDPEATASALVHGIEEGSSDAVQVEVTATKKEVPVEQTPSGSWNSSQGRYIDVDLANQYARLYDASGSVIWESYIVSGDTGGGHGTPTGTYQVYAKETNQDLVGMDYDNDGLPDYRSHVSYWMPFSGGYGLHDATWRDSFGGSIYSYAGSHGCINLPYDAAASLFSMISVGETVVLHW